MLQRADQLSGMNPLLSDPVLRLYGVMCVLLVFKMLAVGTYTSTIRLRRKVFATPEDYTNFGGAAPAGIDPDVERTRRAHQNDLENVLPFMVVGLIYALTNPSLAAARLCFVGFFLARTLHSIFYIRALQPHRTIAFAVAEGLMIFMMVSTLLSLVR